MKPLDVWIVVFHSVLQILVVLFPMLFLNGMNWFSMIDGMMPTKINDDQQFPRVYW